jgi:hypothetical protein
MIELRAHRTAESVRVPLGEPLRSALDDAITRVVQNEGDPDALAALRRCARDARSEGIPADHLAMAVHDVWESGRARRARNALGGPALYGVIGLAIDAYFRGD